MRNAFYAQAVADAIGNRFEFGNHPPESVLQLMHGDHQLHITDDTQMAMFGQEAINLSGGPVAFAHAHRVALQSGYLAWYRTQHETTKPDGNATPLEKSSLMRRREAPGNACLTSLSHLQRTGQLLSNDSKGCGAVMRLLPFTGLYDHIPMEIVHRVARYSAEVTHQHHSVPAAVLTYMYAAYAMKSGAGIEQYSGYREADEIQAFGSGWTAMECVDMALWAVVTATDYDDMLIRAICHPGDSDSVAAVAGSLWGLTGLPGYEKYLPRLVAKPAIDSLF